MERRVNDIFGPTILAVILVATQLVNLTDLRAEESGLDAHVHGLSDLTIAIEGGDIEIEFESPAMNIVGFEYQAQSKKDIEAVEKAAARLAGPDAIFSFLDATCRLIDSSVNVAGVLGEAHDDHESHGDISGAYQFRCEDLSRLSEIQVHLFQFFPGIERIRVMWLREGNQGAITLTAEASKVPLN